MVMIDVCLVVSLFQLSTKNYTVVDGNCERDAPQQVVLYVSTRLDTLMYAYW